MQLELQGPSGRMEAILDLPADGPESTPQGIRAAVALAHPHPQLGGTMHHKVLFHSAKALVGIGCAVLRFNFRGVGLSAGSFGNGIGEKDDYRAALGFLQAQYPGTPLWSAGFSFGAWVATSVGAADARVATLIGIGLPLSYDCEAVRQSPKPKFFIHGERDEITPLKAIRRFYATAEEPKELVVIDGADHQFDGHVSEVGDALGDLLADFGGSREEFLT